MPHGSPNLAKPGKLILASDLDRDQKLELLHSLASREAADAAIAEHRQKISEAVATGEIA